MAPAPFPLWLIQTSDLHHFSLAPCSFPDHMALVLSNRKQTIGAHCLCPHFALLIFPHFRREEVSCFLWKTTFPLCCFSPFSWSFSFFQPIPCRYCSFPEYSPFSLFHPSFPLSPSLLSRFLVFHLL